MISKIFQGDYLRRLDNIIQWQERDVFNHESVSQHSYKVTIFARVLLEDIFGNTDNARINRYKLDCVTHAMFHDWDESLICRDLSHEIKYNKFNGAEIREAIDKFVDHEVFIEFGEETDAAVMLKKNIVEIDPGVKLLVKYCDWLGLLFYCKRELDRHNDSFQPIFDYCTECIGKAGSKLIEWLEVEFGNVCTETIIATEKHPA